MRKGTSTEIADVEPIQSPVRQPGRTCETPSKTSRILAAGKLQLPWALDLAQWASRGSLFSGLDRQESGYGEDEVNYGGQKTVWHFKKIKQQIKIGHR